MECKLINKQYLKKRRLPGGAYAKIYVCVQVKSEKKINPFPWLNRED